MPSEGIQGDERDAYVALSRTTRTNMGSPTGRESHGDGGPVVVAGVTTGQGGRESSRAAPRRGHPLRQTRLHVRGTIDVASIRIWLRDQVP